MSLSSKESILAKSDCPLCAAGHEPKPVLRYRVPLVDANGIPIDKFLMVGEKTWLKIKETIEAAGDKKVLGITLCGAER